MTGKKVFDQMVAFDNGAGQAHSPITEEQYNEWLIQNTFDALKGLRYGQSFCNYFKLTNNIIYYDTDAERTDAYIRKHYLEKSRV